MPEQDARREDSDEEAEFRARVINFLAANASLKRALTGEEGDKERAARLLHEASSSDGSDASDEHVDRAKDFQRRLFEAGLAGLTWPKEYGGQGLSARYDRILLDEASAYETPIGTFFIGFGMCIPTILTHGTETQKRRYVRPAARGEEVWSQMFSEPGAGSDVAGLQTRAVRDGDEWVINGQKVWTTGAHYSDFGILLGRSNPDVPKHEGLTMFIVDLRAAGVTIQPLRQITGATGFNEVFFDDVRVPTDAVLGGVGDGWRVALTTLMNERVTIGAGSTGGDTPVDSLVRLARRRRLNNDPVTRYRLAEVFIRSQIQDFTRLRVEAQSREGGAPGPEGSIAKVYNAQLQRLVSELGIQMAGIGATAWLPEDSSMARWSLEALVARQAGIAGGTDEIQKNIIAERVLGLPADLKVDRGVPFKDIPHNVVRTR